MSMPAASYVYSRDLQAQFRLELRKLMDAGVKRFCDES